MTTPKHIRLLAGYMLAALAVECATTRTGTIVSVSPVAYLQPDSSMAVGMDTEIIVPGVHCLAERGLSCSRTSSATAG